MDLESSRQEATRRNWNSHNNNSSNSSSNYFESCVQSDTNWLFVVAAVAVILSSFFFFRLAAMTMIIGPFPLLVILQDGGMEMETQKNPQQWLFLVAFLFFGLFRRVWVWNAPIGRLLIRPWRFCFVLVLFGIFYNSIIIRNDGGTVHCMASFIIGESRSDVELCRALTVRHWPAPRPGGRSLRWRSIGRPPRGRKGPEGGGAWVDTSNRPHMVLRVKAPPPTHTHTHTHRRRRKYPTHVNIEWGYVMAECY